MKNCAATVGVVAVQGDFAEHIALLNSINAPTREVRLPSDLQGLGGLIIPGGESTTLRHLFDLYDLSDPIAEMGASGTPIWGTCAGMIMMASELTDSRPEPLRLMDITVSRNAYGRQVDSFHQELQFEALGADPFHAIFIRAPAVARVGDDVRVLGALPNGSPVALRQRNLLATSFHPELTDDSRFHRYFIEMIADAAEGS